MNFGFEELLIFAAGIVYGYTNSGKQKKINLLKKGLLFGFILGVILGILQNLSLYYIILLGIIVSVVLVISTFIGSFLKKVKK
jgi:galactitol-specific phosphotransferase system IIC component